MELHNIKDVPDDILTKLNTMMNRDCQAGKFTLSEIRDTYSKNTDIVYIIEKGEPVYFLLLDRFNKQKTVYIHDVCLNNQYRGKGIFKKSLAFLKDHYSKIGFKSFTLDASDSTKEEGLNQKARIHIFHSAGFDINTETGYYKESGDYEIIKTVALLDNGDKVEIQERSGDTYLVKNAKGDEYSITIDKIEKCYDSESNQLSCPMILTLPKMGGRKKRKSRITRKKGGSF